MQKIFSLLILITCIGCSTMESPKELSTQEKIAVIDSILSENNSSVTMESLELNIYNRCNLIFTADRIITNDDSLKFFMLRGKDGENIKGCALILPSEVGTLCSKIDSVLNIVSTPIAYNKAFSVSNNGGLTITAKTNVSKDWELYIDLKMKEIFNQKIDVDFLKFLAKTLKACLDSKGDMKSSEVIIGENIIYHENDIKFFEEIDTISSIKKTNSGLRYEVLVNKEGAKPSLYSSKVKTKYTLFVSGEIKDEGILEVPLNQNRLIPGFEEGVKLQSVGSKYRFYIPSYLGYSDFSGDIPPYSPLIFEVELLSIN